MIDITEELDPDDFVLAVKMSRFLTHLKRLKDPGEPVERFMSRARKLVVGRKFLRLHGTLEGRLVASLKAEFGRQRSRAGPKSPVRSARTQPTASAQSSGRPRRATPTTS